VIRLLSLAALLAAAATPTVAYSAATATNAATPPLPYTLPGKMEQHRFYVDAQAPNGKVLHLFTDTGGATNLTTTGADKLGVSYKMPAKPREQAAGETRWPRYAGAWIPAPLADKAAKKTPDGKDPDALPILAPPPGIAFDGMLGARWFAGRTWQWDYPAGTLRLLPQGKLPAAAPAHIVKLGFQKNDAGAQTTHFPRLPVQVEGVTLQMLFDTGTTFRLDEAAAARLGDAKTLQRAGSFIAMDLMQGWHKDHPDWPWIDRGDAHMPMIQVPDVQVAGWHTGPVWFSARPAPTFRHWMAQWTDQPLDGTVGGNVLASFRVALDYPSATAVFEQIPPKPGVTP
jgi:predicted aspartyl protease